MNSWIDILACPFCKLGMDEIQARAMEYSIYLLLVLVYSLMGVIVYKIARMMSREDRALGRGASAAASARADLAPHAPSGSGLEVPAGPARP